MNDDLTSLMKSICGSKQLDTLLTKRDSLQALKGSILPQNPSLDSIEIQLSLVDASIRDAAFETSRNVLVLGQFGIYSFFALSFLALFIKSEKREIGLLLFFLYFFSSSLNSLATFSGNADAQYLVLLSVINSFCLIFSFQYFNVVKEKNWKIFESPTWLYLSIGGCAATATLSAWFGNPNPDIIFSILIFVVLCPILWFQFKARNSPLLGWLSVAVCGSIIFSQQYALFEGPKEWTPKATFNLMSLISTSALGTIFLALAFTWVFEKQFPKDEAASPDGSELDKKYLNRKVTFSGREKAILQGLKQEKTYGEIASVLHISEETVKSNIKSIKKRLGVSGRVNLVEHAEKAGLDLAEGANQSG